MESLNNLKGKKVLILGLSRSGVPACKYLAKNGVKCFLSDKKLPDKDEEKIVEELKALNVELEFGSHSDKFIEGASLCIISPAIAPHFDIVKKIREKNIEIISDVELIYRLTEIPFIVITGTNGKTTTTSLASHILSTKFNAPSCGNIGVSPVNFIDKNVDYLVCEMSSAQIEYSPTLRAKIACFLTFTPDHINWHGTIENYFKAKIKLFENSPQYAVFSGVDKKIYEYSKHYKNCGSEKYIFGINEYDENSCYLQDDAIYFNGEKIIGVKDVPIVGEHNLQNTMCAIICAKILNLTNKEINSAIKTFKAVEHRCEFVKKIGKTEFFNDSKATNPEASIVAVKAFENKDVVLIAGGRDKNTNLDEFCEEIKNHITTVILIGEATERFENELKKSGFLNVKKEKTLFSAIDNAKSLNPDVVLLSPACASFDMFKNYEVRGEEFKNYVKTIR